MLLLTLLFSLANLPGSGFPCDSAGKEPACNVGDLGSILGLGRSPWRRAWKPTPVFLPGESHGQWTLVVYSLWGFRELDRTEVT